MLFVFCISLDIFVPDPSTPYEIPNFVGRDKECTAVEHHLTDDVTRLVNVWGPPGFGKTSVAIRVAHHLQEKNIPVYFASVRGMESKEDLVSKLLSMFADDTRVGHVSSSHLIIQYLQQIQNPLVLILDNADDLLESGDTRRKENVLQFIEEILTHCKQIKLLLTTRESLDFLNHKLSIYLEKINVLDEISSADLVRLLLPDASDDECNCVVRECGSVPLSMRLMCSLIKEANVSINALLEEMSNSTLVDVLDIECFPNNVRLKSVIKTSFERLTFRERDAFVSLSVFPEWFGLDEAQAILNAKTEFKTKQIIRSLERRSLIDCADNFSHFTIHSLFRSFIEEETKNDQAVRNVFLNAQLQFYDYYISSCKIANENFLKRRFGDAFRSFLDRRGCIISSLLNGPRKDKIYPKAIELLSVAKSFLFVALHGEHLFENLYDTALEEAKKRGNSDDEQRLYSAKELPPSATVVKSFFWLSRVQREAGDLAGAMESVKVGRELLGHHELDVGQQGKADLKGSLDSLQRAANMSSKLLGDHEDTALSYHRLGNVQRVMGDLKGALDSLQRAANMRSSVLGDHEDTASSYYWLGKVQHGMGDLKGALDSLQRAAKIRSSVLGDHKETANSYCSLGLVQSDMGDLKGALDSLQRAANIRSRVLGDHKETANSYYWLGLVQRGMGDLKEALDSLQKAANMESNLLGDHEDTAVSFCWLGLVQCVMGDLKGVLDSLERAANMRSSVLGDHEDTASSYYWLGKVQHAQGDLKGALDSLKRAANMRSSVLGDHKDTASSYHNIGLVQCDMGDLKGALVSLQRVTSIKSNLLGDDADTTHSYHMLGLVQYGMGDLEGALDSLQRAAAMRSNMLGDLEEMASSEHILSIMQRDMKDLEETLESLGKSAETTFNLPGYNEFMATAYLSLEVKRSEMRDIKGTLKSLKIAQNMSYILFGDHEITARSYYKLGTMQREMGDLKGALGSLERATDAMLGDQEDRARSYHELGRVQHKMGDLNEALYSLQIAQKMTSNLLGDHENTVCTYYDLSRVLREMGYLKESLDFLERAANMGSKLLGDHEDTARNYHELGVMQHEMGNLKGASQSLEKAANMRSKMLGDHHEDTISSLSEFRAVRIKLPLKSFSLLGKVFRWKK